MGGLTNFPNGIASFGNPIFGGAMSLPIMGSQGKAFFVDPARGSDGNRGTDWRKPLATVTKAEDLCTDKAGDVVYLLNDGNTSGTSRDTATITWDKDNTHLIGLCAPSMLSQRSRISPPTSQTTIVTPQLTVSGHGCVFANISLFEGTSEDATASVCVSVTGNRNVFHNVAMMNMGDAANGHSGDEAGSANLLITGGEENLFEGCYFGVDTAVRTAANANVRFASAATRNSFVDCTFVMYADADAPLFVDANSSGAIDRWALFKRCRFINAIGAGSTAQSVVAAVHASAGGEVLFEESWQRSGGEWASASNSKVIVAAPTAVSPGGGQALPFTT